MVVWIIGLSGSGKTTLATEVVSQLRKSSSNVVLIDGDMVREIFGNDLDYSLVGRQRNAQRICQLCKLLDNQGINVICAILSLFPEMREWNRQHLKKYFEVYIDAPMEHLESRDSKGIYSRYKKGEINNVAGLDIDFPIPTNADLKINNNQSKEHLIKYAELISKIFLKNN
jgi:adenylylsulfate kinase